MTANPTVVTLTGPSCTGKSVLAQALVRTGRYREVISTTTRAPRPGEVNGQHYHFVSTAEFEAARDAGEFVEWVMFSGQGYAATAREFQRCQDEGKIAVIVVDQHGVEAINHHANAHCWNMVAAFLDVQPAVAVSRFYERFSQESNQNAMLEVYAKRLLKVVTDEREWRHEFDFDIYLPPSLTPADTVRQIAEINRAVERAGIPEIRIRREVRTYSQDVLDRTLAQIQAVLAERRDTEEVVNGISGLAR